MSRSALLHAQPSPGRISRILAVTVNPKATGWGGPFADPLMDELARLGYVRGHNLVIELLFDNGRPGRLAALVRNLAGARPDVIVASTPRPLRALKDAGVDIPIVGSAIEPVLHGLAVSLARPGGSITGVTMDARGEVWGKRLQILKEAFPNVSNPAFLAPPYVLQGQSIDRIRKQAHHIGLTLIAAPVERPYAPAEYRRAFRTLINSQADAVVVSDTPEHTRHRQMIVDWANRVRLPAMYPYREFVTVGGLMAYGIDFRELGRHAAGQIDRIFKGEKPGEIPFYQATTFDLVLNLKTAGLLDVQFPPTLLASASEVVD